MFLLEWICTAYRQQNLCWYVSLGYECMVENICVISKIHKIKT